MKEQDRLVKLFEDLFSQSPWIGVNISDTLNEISAKEAATKPFPNFNSIWEIVNHMISWRETVLKRMQGEEIESPEDNYFSYIRDRSASAWEQTKTRFNESQDKWVKAIKKFQQKELKQKVAPDNLTFYDLLNGILQHDAYHLGQIRLMKKMVQLT